MTVQAIKEAIAELPEVAGGKARPLEEGIAQAKAKRKQSKSRS